jgi:hypothetical protein
MTPDSSTEPNKVVIYPSRAKMSLVLLGSMAFVAIGVWIGTPGVARGLEIWKVVIASYVGVPFFAACGLYAVYRLATHRPALEIDSTGIADAASAVGAGRLSWDEVDHVVLYKYSGQSMLGIVPRNLDIFLSRQPVVRRSLTRLSLALGCAPINVPQKDRKFKLLWPSGAPPGMQPPHLPILSYM